MSIQWLPDGESIIVSGNSSLGIISKHEDDQWFISHEDKISHTNIITSVLAISEQILITCSGDDGIIKIWRLSQDGCECLKEIKMDLPPISIIYDNQSKCLAVMDTSLNLGIFHKDFDSDEEALVEEKI